MTFDRSEMWKDRSSNRGDTTLHTLTHSYGNKLGARANRHYQHSFCQRIQCSCMPQVLNSVLLLQQVETKRAGNRYGSHPSALPTSWLIQINEASHAIGSAGRAKGRELPMGDKKEVS